MTGEGARRLAELRRAYESGILGEDTYQAAVAALDAQAEVQATVEGSGAVAQDHSVAATTGAVAVGRDIRGNVYVGQPTQDPVKALRIYRQVLVGAGCHLPLRGVDLEASDPRGDQQRLELAQVYVDLDTKTPVPLTEEEKKQRERRAVFDVRDTRPLRALEATVANRCLVVLGDPGSGKSTFLNHLVLCLAAHGLEPQADWSDRLPGWPEGEADLVPIPVILRDFSRWLPEDSPPAEPRHLWDFIVGRLEAQNLDFVARPLHQALEEGQAIVLLDGLDEIPTRQRRTFVRDAVAAFAGRYPRSRVAITCRVLSYQDPAWQLEGFPPFELAPFDEAKIDGFVKAWYAELARLGVVKAEEAAGLAQRLQEAVRRSDLWQLASNPLLLTVMALVHTHKGRLPDARALLYEDTVDILLWRWEQIKTGGDKASPRMRQLLLETGRTDVDLKRVLWRLAFEAHGAGDAGDGETLADIGEWRLGKALAELHPDKSLDWAQQVISAIKLRAGLLLERAPEVYTFPHRTFQEYLAGAHLSAQADFARQAVVLVEEGALWRQVVLLAVGRLVYLAWDTDKPLALVGELCTAKAADDEAAWQKAWLAGEALAEMGVNRVQDSALGRDLVERVRDRLAALVGQGCLSPVERAAAGDALARLGDPRFRADAWYLPNEPLLGFVKVPAGSFLMDSDKVRDRDAMDRELPQHTVELPTYYMARYPVTVAQFRAFVEASGYEPQDPDSLQGQPNHPVVWVTWYDAIEYCRWLTGELRVWGSTPEPLAGPLRDQDWEVRLPTEAEWEKAARGTDGRIFPWGDRPDPERANYGDTGIGTTSAVGCFPGGASPCGVLDLSGNVWEWTHSLWGTDWKTPDFKYPYEPGDGREDESAGRDVLRVLRGGAFFSSAGYVRCAARCWRYPGYRSRDLGFRGVVAPGFHSGL